MNQSTKALLRSLTTALVCAAVIFAFLISGIRLLGFDVYGVLTGSMVPAYPIGSLIYVQDVDPNELELRDVITFSSGKTIVTHRIVEIVRDDNNPYQLKFRTKGDANNDPDASLVGPADIIGKVAFGIPHLGTIANYIQNPPGLYVTIVIGLALIGLVIFMDTDDNKQAEAAKNGVPVQKKPLNLPWLTNILAKVGITWPKEQSQPTAQPPYPGYAPQQYQQMPQQYAQPMAQPYQQMPQQQYPQYQQQAPVQYPQQMPGQPMQPYQQMPQQQYPQYQQQAPVQYQQYPQQMQNQPMQSYQQMPQQQYPQYQQQGQQYPQQYQQPQQYGAPLERPKNPLG